jgi:molybdopterin molybdotransferase
VTRFVGHGRREVTTADELTPVDEHLAAILDMLPEPAAIELRLADALGLVLAEDLVSRVRVPDFANAAMDGYAVVVSDLEGATSTEPIGLPVVGEVAAGSARETKLAPGRAARIMTGAPLPAGAEAVVPVETTSGGGGGQVYFHAPVAAGTNVRNPGEDLRPGQPLLSAGHRISPADIALLAVAGVARVRCLPPPRVVVLSSGDELVPAEVVPGPGQIRDANGPMLAAMIRAAGGVSFSAGIVPDDAETLRRVIDANLGHADLVLSTGGASAGTRDLLPDVIGELGEVRSVKVAMRPGMPQILGRIRGTPVIGLPGNPVSAFVSFEVFVRPALRRLQGRRGVDRPTVTARAGARLSAPRFKRGYTRVRLERDGDGWIATPTGPQGSHVISSIALANGLAVVPEDVMEIPEGGAVTVRLLVD